MEILLKILWIIMWGATGYFTVRTIQIRRQNKRIVEQLIHTNELLNRVDKTLEKD